MKFQLLAFCHSSLAATIAQLLAADPTLSKASALSASNPAWSAAGQITVFAPTNTAIAAAAAGVLDANQGTVTFLNYVGINDTYFLVQNTKSVYTLVFNNGAPGQTANPNADVRFGQGSGSISKIIVADNGILYVSNNIAIGPPAGFTTTLTSLGCSKFAALIQSLGITSFINEVTIFAPTDAGYANSNIDSMTKSEQLAHVFHQIVPQVILTNNIKTGNYTTLLDGNTIDIVASSSGATFPGNTASTNMVFSQSDNFCTNGVIQRLDFWLGPVTTPTGSVVPSNVPAGSAAYVISADTTTSGSTPKQSNSASVQGVASGLVGLAGLLML